MAMKSFDTLHREPTDSVADIALQPLWAGQWRVLDNRQPTSDVRALLGFLQQTDDSYELTLIGHPGETHTLCDLDAVYDTVHAATHQPSSTAEDHSESQPSRRARTR
jgi:hypothetical protein